MPPIDIKGTMEALIFITINRKNDNLEKQHFSKKQGKVVVFQNKNKEYQITQ